jgi:excisionase family DNA binding protein
VTLVEAQRNDEFSYTPTEAALILRVSPTRVRQLLQDGELEGERDAVGHWLIPTRAVHERLELLRRESFLEAVGYDPSIVHAIQERAEVLSTQVEMLRAELEEAHAANRENRRIIAALTERISEIEVPSEPPGGPQNAGVGSDREGPPPGGARAQEGSEQPPDTAEWPVRGSLLRPWWRWRRMFGG